MRMYSACFFFFSSVFILITSKRIYGASGCDRLVVLAGRSLVKRTVQEDAMYAFDVVVIGVLWRLFVRPPSSGFRRVVIPNIMREFMVYSRHVVHDINHRVNLRLGVVLQLVLEQEDAGVPVFATRLAPKPMLRESVPNAKPVLHRVRRLRPRLHQPHETIDVPVEHLFLVKDRK